MKNFKQNFKSIVQSKARWLLTLFAILTLGVGQMWATDLYLRGIYSKDGTAGDNAWKTDNSNKMSESSGTYTLVTYLTAATHSFKIADSDWNYDNTYEANNSSATVTVGTAYSTWHNGGKGNLSLTISTAGFYKFSLKSGSLTVSRYNPTPSAAAPSAVVSGTNAMFYIEGYVDVNYNVLRGESSHSIDSHSTGISKGNKSISYVNTAKTNLTTNDYVSNNPGSWNGVENTNIKTATGGEYFVANGSTSKTAAKTASTTTSVSGDVLSISTTTNATTGVLNGSMYIQYYIDGTFAGVTYSAATASYASIPAGGATARASTYDVSGLTNGSHTLKTVLTDGIIYWVADQDNFNVAHSYTITYKDKGNVSYSGSNSASLPGSYTYGTGIATLTAGEKSGYVFDGWFDNEGCTGDPVTTISTTATGNKTFYAKFTQIGITLTAETGGQVSKDNSNWYDEVTITGISFGTNYNIYAYPEDGYSFTGWTKGTNSSNTTLGDASDESTTVSVSSGAVTTLTAGFSETMRTITIVGGTDYTSGATTTTAGVSTKAKLVADAPAAGKKFTGWSLGAGASLADGYATTDRTIEITATANATVTANYADRASVKMYFAKPTTMGWSKVYAYAWKSTDASVRNAAYPGVELDETEVVNNIVYYVYQYYTEADGIGGAATGNSAWNRVVFGDNNDARKTADLTIADGHYYYMKSSTTGSGSAIANAWFIKGTMNSWGEDNPIAHDRSTNSGTVTINLEKDIQYEFKVYDQVSDTMWSNSAALGGITNSVDATTLYNNDLNVMKITPNKTGAYVFTITNTNTTAPKIAVDYPSQYLVGSWDSWDEDDHMFDANGYVRVYLTTSKDPYQFQVKYNGRWYGAKGAGTITSTTKDWGFSVSDGSDYNVSITIGTDGYYVFGWNGKDKKISVIYPADTTKAQLAPSKYIYFDARNLTAAGWWIDEFSTRFWLKNYASGVDITHVDCDIVDTVENKVFYALVPTEGQVGQVHLNRMSTNFAENWNEANKVYAVDRDNTDQNCLKEETGKEGDFTGWTPQWTKYCPPMTSATLTAVNAADKTVVYAGSGTKADPYIVATSAYIYVSASSVSKLNDANMEAQYCWYKTNVAESAYYNSSNTHIYTASSSNNVTDSMTVDAKNYYSSTYGRVSPRSNAIYYTARTPYNVAIYEYNVTKTSGATGSKGAVNNVAYIATFEANEGYNLPASSEGGKIVVLSSSTDITANCTWSVSDGVGTLTVPAAYVTADLAISVYGVLKTYTISYDKGTYGTGTLAADTKTHFEDLTLSSNSTAFTRDGYAYDGWSEDAGGSAKDYEFGGTYDTEADETLYPHWVAAYSVTHSLTNVSTASGATGSIAGVSGYNYVATFTADAGYALPSTIGVTVGGAAKTQGTHFTWSVAAGVGTLTILAAQVTGAIVVTMAGTPVDLTYKAGNWNTASSWDPACVPTIEHKVIIKRSCMLQTNTAKAKSVEIHNYGDGKTEGWLWIYSNALSVGGLVVAEGITAVHSEGGDPEATTKDDLFIDTDSYGNAGLVCGNASANTEAIYYFYTKAYKYSSKWYINQYVGIPFVSMDANQLYGFNIFVYDDAADDWRTPTGEDAEILQAWKAYNLIRQYGSTDWNHFRMEGTLNLPGTTGDGRLKTFTCGSRYATEAADPVNVGHSYFDNGGDHLFANSWTAPIDISSIDGDDMDGDDFVQTIYIFNAGYESGSSSRVVGDLSGQWSAYPIHSSTYMGGAVIPATQAFLVTSLVENAELTLDYKKHVYDPALANGINTTPTKAPRRAKKDSNDPQILKITVNSNDTTIADQLYIFQRKDFKTDSLDNGWDGYKIAGESYAAEIYTIRGNANMAVDAVKDMDNTSVAFKASSQDSEYTLSFEYSDDEPLYLYDKETNAYTEITNEATYEFTTTDRKAHERFLLTRSNAPQIATGVEEVENEAVQRAQKFMQDQQIFIRRGDRVYNVTGFLVK